MAALAVHRAALASSALLQRSSLGISRRERGQKRGAEGGEIETAKASRGKGTARGRPPPQPTTRCDERRKLPQRGTGQSPGGKLVLVLFEL